jgi:hypothetical protein
VRRRPTQPRFARGRTPRSAPALTGFNLLIYADRIVSLRGFTTRSAWQDAQVDVRVRGRSKSLDEAAARMRRREDERIADVLLDGEDEALRQFPGNRAVPTELIAQARFASAQGSAR